jgi:hypothetical protein
MAAARMSAPARSPAAFRAHLYPPFWRWAAAALFAFSRLNLILALVLVLEADDPPITPPMLAEYLLLFSLLPGVAAALIRRAFAVEMGVEGDLLVAVRPGLRLEVPCASIEDVEPWRLPLPGPGFALRLRSGRRLGYGVHSDDVAALVEELRAAGVAAPGAREQATIVYAAARAQTPRGFWRGPLAKFVLFSLPWGAIFFNADQHITYGGTFGQCYLYGLAPYLRSFAFYWGGLSMYELLYASVWRGLAEALSWGAAGVAPSLAARVRRTAESACLAVFYAGVPLLVLLRFLP